MRYYWDTTLAPKTGDYHLGTTSDDGARLYLDGKLTEQDWSDHPARVSTAVVHLEQGRPYQVKIEFYQNGGQASISLVWRPPVARNYSEAVDLARRSDAVVMVLGISGEVENEEHDRTSIELPPVQQGLLRAVLATGKPVVAVIESGSCIALDPKPLHGLIEAWYPGEEGGRAVAEVLFGKTNPSGRLSVTCYKSLAQVPPFEDYKMAGRTYRYLADPRAPMYSFGYGLSYTKFRYSDLRLSHYDQAGKWPILAEVFVQNVGNEPGDEVVQAYASRSGAAWPEPLRKLVGFARVHLQPGESRTVVLDLKKEALAQADGQGRLSVVPGTYTIAVGGGEPGAEPPSSGRDATSTLRLGP